MGCICFASFSSTSLFTYDKCVLNTSRQSTAQPLHTLPCFFSVLFLLESGRYTHTENEWVSIAAHVVHLVKIMPSYWLFTAKLIYENVQLNAYDVHLGTGVSYISTDSICTACCCHSHVNISIKVSIVVISALFFFSRWLHLPRYFRILFLEFISRVCEIHTGNVYLEFHSLLRCCGLSYEQKWWHFLYALNFLRENQRKKIKSHEEKIFS